MTLTSWIEFIKDILHSHKTKSKIRTQILNTCLYSSKKICGAYQVNSTLVWENIIISDESCKKRCEELKLRTVDDAMGYYEEVLYKRMRATYPKKHHKKG